MPSSDIKRAVEDVDSSKNTHSFPDWTKEDDRDDISSIAHRQRLRFRAASVAGRQRLRSAPREEISIRNFGDLGKGVGAAASAFASGAGQAVADVAHGFGQSAGAAASAFAEGKGFLGAAGAAAESVADGIGKGANDAAGAVASANGAFASAVAGGDDSDDSDDDKKTKTTANDDSPSTQTSLPPPPPSQTATTDPPEVTATTPPPKPPQQTTQPPSPSSGQKQPDPPKSTQQPIDNVPPPKAEEPPSGKPDDSPSGNPPSAKPTSSNDNQKLTLSTLVPGAAIITTQSGTRLLLTPIITGTPPAVTSGTSKVYSGPDFDSTTPFAVGPGPTTMMTSISPTGDLRTGESGQPSNNIPKDKGDDGSIGAHDQSHQQSGASPLIAIVVLGICAFLAFGYYFWRRRKQQREFASNNRDAGDLLSAPPRSHLDRAKRSAINVASRIPFLRDKLRSTNRWETIDDPFGTVFPEKNGVSAAGFPGMTEPPRIMVQTTFTQRSSIVSKFKAAVTGGALPSIGSWTKATSTGEGANAGLSATAQANGGTSGQGAASSDPNPLGLSPFIAPKTSIIAEPAKITSQDGPPLGANHGPKPSFSSTAPQYNLTLQSTYGAGRRISELSSLSSGFGDGDIIIPPQPTRKSTASLGRLQGRPYTGGAENTGGGNSGNSRNRSSTATMATARSISSARRDTVYTEASEDFPPRFRTVSSWVNQQSGRVKRQEQRVQDTANKTGAPPPVPPIPPEQDFRLMMPDGEEPRRVEDTNVNTSTGDGKGGGDWGAETKSMLNVVIGTAH